MVNSRSQCAWLVTIYAEVRQSKFENESNFLDHLKLKIKTTAADIIMWFVRRGGGRKLSTNLKLKGGLINASV